MNLFASSRACFRRFAGLFRKRRRDLDLEAEIESHLLLHIDDNLRAGMSPPEARRLALLQFGGVESAKQAYRDRRGIPFLETLWQDVRFAARMLRKSPGFTFVAVLTLALGIGANTAIFSVVDGVLLRPLAYPQPQQLYVVREIVPQWAKSTPSLPANLPDFQIWQDRVHSFEGVAIAEETSADLTGVGEPQQIDGMRVSAGLLNVLGIRPALGSGFLPQQDQVGRGFVVVLANRFWRSRFHADPSILGKTITLDGFPHTVVGVLLRISLSR